MPSIESEGLAFGIGLWERTPIGTENSIGAGNSHTEKNSGRGTSHLGRSYSVNQYWPAAGWVQILAFGNGTLGTDGRKVHRNGKSGLRNKK
jgi:hypothetical protein